MRQVVLFFLVLLILFLSLSFVLILKDYYLKKAFYIFKFENHEFLSKLFLSNKEYVPKICEQRAWGINLSKNLIYFYENCKLKRTIPIDYQSPPDVWYQTPTGYFRIGVKNKEHISSIFPVYMNYAVQFYEDFFIHEIPRYLNGERVRSTFTGGCIRLETNYAKEVFNLAKSGDLVVSYFDLSDFKVKDDFAFPVNKDQFYIRQRFNNPLRTRWLRPENRKGDYIQHAGIDLSPEIYATDLNVYNIYKGKIVKIVKNGENDHGLGNTVIVEHNITLKENNSEKKLRVFSLYGHLSEINDSLKENEFIEKGKIIGKVGATGYGCNFWRIGPDGCDSNLKLDIHLHFEIKDAPVLGSPKEAECFVNGEFRKCYGYTPSNPTSYGYFDPLKFLTIKINKSN